VRVELEGWSFAIDRRGVATLPPEAEACRARAVGTDADLRGIARRIRVTRQMPVKDGSPT
jgi:hypothetical protein